MLALSPPIALAVKEIPPTVAPALVAPSLSAPQAASGSGLLNRVRHLITQRKTSLDIDKAEWMPRVPDTLMGAHARAVDDQTGRRLYARKYANGVTHLVVVDPDGVVEDQLPFTGKLITQFHPQEGVRQWNFRVDWQKNRGLAQEATGSLRQSPAARSGGSTAADLPTATGAESSDDIIARLPN